MFASLEPPRDLELFVANNSKIFVFTSLITFACKLNIESNHSNFCFPFKLH